MCSMDPSAEGGGIVCSMDPSAEGEVLCAVWTRQLRGRYCVQYGPVS